MPSLLVVRETISIAILEILLYSPVDEYSEPSQVSKIDLFMTVVNGFELTMMNISAKKFIADIWRCPE